MKKVAVVGGAGFIGSNIVDTLVDKGIEVVVLDNLSTGYLKNVNKKAKFVECDISKASAENLKSLLKGCKVVFHTAALARVQPSIINPVELDTVTTRLESIGFAPPKAKTMASILIQVAQTEGIGPHDYFTPGEQSLKLTVDTYEVMNTLRPSGNKVGLVAPISNSKSRFKSQIQK